MARRVYTWRRVRICLALSAFSALTGLGVRLAESNQVGYTHDSSMWIFVVSGLFLYYAVIVSFVLMRSRPR